MGAKCMRPRTSSDSERGGDRKGSSGSGSPSDPLDAKFLESSIVGYWHQSYRQCPVAKDLPRLVRRLYVRGGTTAPDQSDGAGPNLGSVLRTRLRQLASLLGEDEAKVSAALADTTEAPDVESSTEICDRLGGDDSPTVRILKLATQSVVGIGMTRLMFGPLHGYMTADIRDESGWTIVIDADQSQPDVDQSQPDVGQPKSDVDQSQPDVEQHVHVLHRRRERILGHGVELSWTIRVSLDATVSNILAVELAGVAVHPTGELQVDVDTAHALAEKLGCRVMSRSAMEAEVPSVKHHPGRMSRALNSLNQLNDASRSTPPSATSD